MVRPARIVEKVSGARRGGRRGGGGLLPVGGELAVRLAVAGFTKRDEVVHCVGVAALFDGAAVVDVQIIEGAAMPAAVAVEPEAKLSDVPPIRMIVQGGLVAEADSVDTGDAIHGAGVFQLGVPATGGVGEQLGTVGTPGGMLDFHTAMLLSGAIVRKIRGMSWGGVGKGLEGGWPSGGGGARRPGVPSDGFTPITGFRHTATTMPSFAGRATEDESPRPLPFARSRSCRIRQMRAPFFQGKGRK